MGRQVLTYSVDSHEFRESIWLRYNIILLHSTRLICVPVFIVLLIADGMVISGWVGSELYHYDVSGNVPKYSQYLICNFFAIPFTIFFAILMIYSNSETILPNLRPKLRKLGKLELDRDYPFSNSILQRTVFRYCATLEVRGTKMIIVDKVTGLENGDLQLEDIGECLDDDMVKFKLDVNQITAVWISRDLVVMRFCWGMTYRSAWDVIVDRSKFVVGTDVDFIKFLKKNLKGKRITNNYLKFVNHPEKFRLGNYSTDTKTPFFTQRRVKIYHNFWGPFKKRERKSKEKETEK